MNIQQISINDLKPYPQNAKKHPAEQVEHIANSIKEQISAKRKSLEGVLVPITAKWNEQLLESAGFKKIDCFYRYLNFAGWIAIK